MSSGFTSMLERACLTHAASLAIMAAILYPRDLVMKWMSRVLERGEINEMARLDIDFWQRDTRKHIGLISLHGLQVENIRQWYLKLINQL
jgi:hypothetical protein